MERFGDGLKPCRVTTRCSIQWSTYSGRQGAHPPAVHLFLGRHRDVACRDRNPVQVVTWANTRDLIRIFVKRDDATDTSKYLHGEVQMAGRNGRDSALAGRSPCIFGSRHRPFGCP